MSSVMSATTTTSRCASSSCSRVDVLRFLTSRKAELSKTAGVAALLLRHRRWWHAHIWQGGLITSVSASLRGHAHTHWLLCKLLLGRGETILLWRGKVTLYLVVCLWQLLLRLNHAKVDILLVLGSDLLLLLLKKFDLLGECKLLHYRMSVGRLW